MLSACQIIVSEATYPELFAFAEANCMLAKNLYNAALFRIRQVFTGWGKESRTDNEAEVFKELELTSQADKKFHYRRVLKYYPLERILRATENPDFLPDCLCRPHSGPCAWLQVTLRTG